MVCIRGKDVSEVGMYLAGIQPVGFGPMPSTGLARMYLFCTQTDPRIQLLHIINLISTDMFQMICHVLTMNV